MAAIELAVAGAIGRVLLTRRLKPQKVKPCSFVGGGVCGVRGAQIRSRVKGVHTAADLAERIFDGPLASDANRCGDA